MEDLAKKQIERPVIKLISEMIGAADHSMIDSTIPLKRLGIDSLGMINLLLGIEKEFSLTVPEEDFTPENFGTAASIIEYLSKRILLR